MKTPPVKQLHPDPISPTDPISPKRSLVTLWRMIFGPRTPKPHGPCKYCGEDTDEVNQYAPDQFVHWVCIEMAYQKRQAAQEEREKIDLIKKAIRELEAEKQNASGQVAASDKR